MCNARFLSNIKNNAIEKLWKVRGKDISHEMDPIFSRKLVSVRRIFMMVTKYDVTNLSFPPEIGFWSRTKHLQDQFSKLGSL